MQLKLFWTLLFTTILLFTNDKAFSQQKTKPAGEKWELLKKSFKPDKAFIFPGIDSSNTALQTFADELAAVEGVKEVSFAMKDNSTYIVLETKQSMISIWNKLSPDTRSGYKITERSPEGFKMAATGPQTVSTNNSAPRGETAYEQAARETNENYKPDTSKKKSVWQMQQDHAEELRQRNKTRSMNISDYHNDSVVYKTYPKPPSGKFLEYTVNGKKFFYQDYTKNIDNTATFNAYEGIPLSKNGLKIQIQPATVTTLMTFDIFYPFKHPKGRRFHFGTDSTFDKNVPSERINLPVKMELFAALKKLSEWNIKQSPSERIMIYNQKNADGQYETNIEKGYLQVLFFETGAYGTLEAFFKFKTKPYTDKDGKPVKAATVEGRFRIKGNFPAR